MEEETKGVVRLVGGPCDGHTYQVPNLEGQIRVYVPRPVATYLGSLDENDVYPVATMAADVVEYLRCDLLVAEPSRTALRKLNRLADYHTYVYVQDGGVW